MTDHIFGAYIARPKTLRAPAVVVLHEVFGVKMTFLTAARYGVDTAVVYHGGDTEKYLDEINGP